MMHLNQIWTDSRGNKWKVDVVGDTRVIRVRHLGNNRTKFTDRYEPAKGWHIEAEDNFDIGDKVELRDFVNLEDYKVHAREGIVKGFSPQQTNSVDVEIGGRFLFFKPTELVKCVS